jgi:hypothetical protein
MKTANGENPLMHGASPILGCDVWEHSYYIDYRNARPKYLEAFIDNLVNWEYVEQDVRGSDEVVLKLPDQTMQSRASAPGFRFSWQPCRKRPSLQPLALLKVRSMKLAEWLKKSNMSKAGVCPRGGHLAGPRVAASVGRHAVSRPWPCAFSN